MAKKAVSGEVITAGMHRVQIKPGHHHGTLHPDYDPKKPGGKPGPRAVGGDIIVVTEAELEAFSDKFNVLDD